MNKLMKKPVKSWNKPINTKDYFIYGIHPSIAALNNKARKVKEIVCTTNIFEKHQSLIELHNFKVVESIKIAEALPEGSVHQGIAVRVEYLPHYSIEDVNEDNPNIKVAILDQISDPHNIGAILRSAAAFNIEALILTDDNSPIENAIIAKTSSGALEVVKIIRLTNLAAGIKTLKKKGFWILGLDSNTEQTFTKEITEGKIAIALGAEGKGLRRLTKENCDFLVKISMSEDAESLNVSNAAAIAFYEAYKSTLNI
jgi:23S rRNA (guanosine2251-2'-O)-methyltransferase